MFCTEPFPYPLEEYCEPFPAGIAPGIADTMTALIDASQNYLKVETNYDPQRTCPLWYR